MMNDDNNALMDTLFNDYHISKETLLSLYGDEESIPFQFGIQDLVYLLSPTIPFTDQLKGIIDTILSYHFTYETIQAVSTCELDAIIDFHLNNKNLRNEDAFHLAIACYRIFLVIVQNKK